MPVGRVYDNGAAAPLPSGKDAELFDAYTKAFPDRRRLDPGFSVPLEQTKGGAPLALRLIATRQTVIAPPSGAAANGDRCKALTTDPPDGSDNANSTAWVLELGRFRFFDAGDLTWNVEAKLACPADLVGKVDVYQVTHHGLAVSNNDVLLRTIAPTVAVMNNGARKGTDARTVDTLKSLASIQASYQLHKNVRPDNVNGAPDAQVANLEEQCSANYIRLRVAPDGARYTVDIPAKGHTRTFQTR
jgi:competence protein ComEC